MAAREELADAAVRCHYEVLGVERNADIATIKKAHRKLALKLHPDKNIGDDDTHHLFLTVQQAYECLSDASERKWYDEHRDAILKGWTSGGGSDNDSVNILFDVVPFMYAGCYTGYGDDPKGFFSIYGAIFQQVFQGELEGFETSASTDYLAVTFGTSQSSWDDVAAFYRGWESFSSGLSFAWADQWNLQEAENRQVRRAMEEDNKRSRKAARRTRNDEVAALVNFVKRRDPRVQARKQQMDEEKAARENEMKEAAASRKMEKKQAMELWREQAEQEQAAAEEEDRQAGRIRLADLEDDYDYGGRKKKGKKNKKKKKKEKTLSSDEEEEKLNSYNDEGHNGLPADEMYNEFPVNGEASGAGIHDVEVAMTDELAAATEDPLQQLDDEEDFISDSSEEEFDSWRCECCKKDFKSEGQIENHRMSKKHKVAWKKYEAIIGLDLLEEMINELNIDE